MLGDPIAHGQGRRGGARLVNRISICCCQVALGAVPRPWKAIWPTRLLVSLPMDVGVMVAVRVGVVVPHW